MEDPKFTKPNTAIADPNRPKLLKDIEDPKCALSRTDNENTDPRRAKPNNDTELPKRKFVRKDSEEPT
jgi:hypothetical protein